jgi:type II secretory ATPase GspE/PulE/Tfp pilus assembly ATPase PilB-like protein
LGLLPEDQELVAKTLERTHGMLLVTGPTGSGKTTTLYTLLGLLNKPGVNIITIEDPVENKINRITQIQVNTQINLTFAGGLRSVLRQDPDIIMVGEIRDKDTAVIATNAAMTGHMVFSTVHANTAAGAIPRMIDLGVEPFLMASTLNMVIAQRLVRVLCTKCKTESPLNPILKTKLEKVKTNISPDVSRMLNKFYEPVGCNTCHKTGYKGRIGIFELVNVDSKVKKLINSKATTEEIEMYARKKGAKTMLEDGLIKVSKGLTTLEEVFRVISQ